MDIFALLCYYINVLCAIAHAKQTALIGALKTFEGAKTHKNKNLDLSEKNIGVDYEGSQTLALL